MVKFPEWFTLVVPLQAAVFTGRGPRCRRFWGREVLCGRCS